MTLLRVLFWNMGCTATLEHLKFLVDEHQIEILVLAECPHSSVDISVHLNSIGHMRYLSPPNLSNRLKFVVALPPDRFESIYDSGEVAIRRVYPPIGRDLLLVALHLPSKLYMSSDEQSQLATRIPPLINENEDRIGHRRTLVIGDFNMDPFEHGLIGSEGFHATMSRSIAAEHERTVSGASRRFFYNPMWSLFGDNPEPAGTFYRGSGTLAYFWHMFDQVLLRPDLAEHFVPGDVFIVDSLGRSSLTSERGRPLRRISDHLPIVARIRLEG